MYADFYHLSGMPFSLLPDADFLFPSRRHRRVMNLLDYGAATQAGFMVVTGEVGAGKTTILRRFIKQAGDDTRIGLITNPSQTFGRLMNWVAMAFELSCASAEDATIYHAFVDFLVKAYGAGHRVVLIIDEAQNLDSERLEELRMLSNVNNEKDQLLQIILVGQPELMETLKRPALRQFVQRVSVHCHLDPLTPAETASYIRYRLSLVDGRPDLFTDEACAAVHYFTNGIPRLINLLCDQALMYGFSDDREQIDAATVAEVAHDRAASGLSPFREIPETITKSRFAADLAPILRAMKEEK